MARIVIACADCEGTLAQIKRIWDVIQRRQIAMNFFFMGETAREFPSLIREIAGEHNSDSHTMSHLNLRQMPKEAQRAEILAGKAAVEDVIGRRTYGFRAPFHAINKETVEVLNEEGFRYDLSGLYYRFEMGSVVEMRPTWYREWTGLYERLRLTPHQAWNIMKVLFWSYNPLIIPVHPHYSGRDDSFAAALDEFILYTLDHGARYMHIADFLKERGLWGGEN